MLYESTWFRNSQQVERSSSSLSMETSYKEGNSFGLNEAVSLVHREVQHTVSLSESQCRGATIRAYTVSVGFITILIFIVYIMSVSTLLKTYK